MSCPGDPERPSRSGAPALAVAGERAQIRSCGAEGRPATQAGRGNWSVLVLSSRGMASVGTALLAAGLLVGCAGAASSTPGSVGASGGRLSASSSGS